VAKKQKLRTIIFYKDYFQEFFVKQRDKVKDKIIWTLDLIEELQRIPETYLKHIDDIDGFLKFGFNKAATFFASSVF
jgi:hypothetical protein